MNKVFKGIHGKITVAVAGPAVAFAAMTSAGTGGSAVGQPAAARDAGGSDSARSPGLIVPAPSGTAPAARARPSGAAAGRAARTGISLTAADFGGSALLQAHKRTRRGRSRRQIARWLLVHRFHWRRWQFKYLDRLWNRESGWNSRATNPYSGAYGIPQAVPAVKMSSAGPDWRSNARTQILWGMRYIRDRYRTPYWAWRHECDYGWY